MVKKIGKRNRKKSKNNLMKSYVDFVGLAYALSEANEEDIKDGSKIADNKRFTESKKTKTVNLGNGLQGKVAKNKIKEVKTYYQGGRDTRDGQHTNNNNVTPEQLTKQQKNFIRISRLIDTAEYYEVDPIITKHMQSTNPLPVTDEQFKLPFNRCFFSTKLKTNIGEITGILLDRCNFYIVRDTNDNSYTLNLNNTELCKCGKYKYEHAMFPQGDGGAEGCERFTWDGTKIAQEVVGYSIHYRWDYKGEMYIKDSLIAFPQKNVHNELLNDSITTQTIKDFLVNLSFYLTIPERIYIEKKRDMGRRFNRGKIPIPSSTYITCNNKLKIYLNKYDKALSEGGKAIHKHRRVAHWRKYTHKKFINVPVITRPDGSVGKYIWVKPTIVGSGTYIPQHRKIKK